MANFIKDNFGRILFALLLGFVLFVLYRLNAPMEDKSLAKVESKIPQIPAATTISQDEQTPVNSQAAMDKGAVESIVKDYIMNNPDLIVRSIEEMHKNKASAANQQIDQSIKENLSALEDISTSPYIGNKDGAITIVAFLDYNCSFCQKSNDVLYSLVASDNRIKVIYKLYPILGPKSEEMTRVALAMYKLLPEKFRAVNEDLMHPDSNSDPASIAKKYSVDPSVLRSTMESVTQAIQETATQASKIKVEGVPAFIINGSFYPEFIDLESMKQIINKTGNLAPTDSALK